MRSPLSAWVHTTVQVAGLMMVAVAVWFGAGWVWGLGTGGAGLLVVGIALERGRPQEEIADAG